MDIKHPKKKDNPNAVLPVSVVSKMRRMADRMVHNNHHKPVKVTHNGKEKLPF